MQDTAADLLWAEDQAAKDRQIKLTNEDQIAADVGLAQKELLACQVIESDFIARSFCTGLLDKEHVSATGQCSSSGGRDRRDQQQAFQHQGQLQKPRDTSLTPGSSKG